MNESNETYAKNSYRQSGDEEFTSKAMPMQRSFLFWYGQCWRKYATFIGRARRSEYWSFVLLNSLMVVIMFFMPPAMQAHGINGNVVRVIAFLFLGYVLVSIIPGIAVTVRRLHDIGRSGWWWLISLLPYVGLILFVFMCRDSQPGSNQYGQNPKI